MKKATGNAAAFTALLLCILLLFSACSDGKTDEVSKSSSERQTQEEASSASEAKYISLTESSTDYSAKASSISSESSISSVFEEAISESETSEASEIREEIVNTEPQTVCFDESWEFAYESAIHTGSAILYRASSNRKNIVIGVNAGHGTQGGSSVKTYCHPDHSEKVTGGSTAAGSTMATAVAYGMTFADGTEENMVTLKAARIFRDLLLAEGYDVLMVRDDSDVQLDSVARTVMCNNLADCHIALHWDGDGLDYDKGCFYCAVPDGIKGMYPVSECWEKHTELGECLIAGLRDHGKTIMGSGAVGMDLTQTSYSKVPSVDIELGNQCSSYDDETLTRTAEGLLDGVNRFFGQ